MSYAVPSLQPIRDEIDREVVINAGWVDVTGQRQKDTEYENTTGRTYEVILRAYFLEVRLRNSDGSIVEFLLIRYLSFQLKPGESVEVLSDDDNLHRDIHQWLERQL
jgi:hypothetical protein